MCLNAAIDFALVKRYIALVPGRVCRYVIRRIFWQESLSTVQEEKGDGFDCVKW